MGRREDAPHAHKNGWNVCGRKGKKEKGKRRGGKGEEEEKREGEVKGEMEVKEGGRGGGKGEEEAEEEG